MEDTKKFFSQRAITIATYFGGPLAAGILVKKNYETLGKADHAQKALLIGIVSTLLLIAGILSLPQKVVDAVPSALIPGIYTLIIYLVVEHLQGEVLKQHKESGGEFYSGRKAAKIGLVSMLILLATIAAAGFISGDLTFTNPDFDAKAYDAEVARFVKNENEAVAVFNVIKTARHQYLVKEFSKGVVIWKENRGIVQKIDSIENLPDELREQDKKLLRYCDLRIQQYDLLIKAISEKTDKYVPELDRISSQIMNILDELKQ